MSFRNPIISGFYPDPTICRVGEDYYLATSSFEYFPGVPIFHSRDLVNWTQLGHALTRRSQLDLTHAKSSGGIYAPTLRHHQGRFYLVTTDTTGIGNFIVHTADPAGEWSEPIRVPLGGIDPSLFFHDGRVYFAANGLHWAERGVYLTPIDLVTGAPRAEPRFLWAGIGGKFPEAPHLYQRNGWFYLLISEGGTEFGHMVTVARSRDLFGPYESCPRNPILSHRSLAQPLQATGHGDFVDTPDGNWWMVFLATRPVGYPQAHHLGRETCLAPVTWDDDGFPVVNGGAPVPLKVGDSFAPLPATKPQRDSFSGRDLAPDWNFRRNPIPGAWAIESGLVLRCVAASLDDTAPQSWVGQRQRHFDCRVETELDFEPVHEGELAGLGVVMNERHHTELIAGLSGGRRQIWMRRRVGSLITATATRPLPDGAVGLRIVANEHGYRMMARLEEGWCALETVETRHLSTEVAGGFTGVYFGLFATGSGRESATSGRFAWFDYEALPELNPERAVASQTTRFFPR